MYKIYAGKWTQSRPTKLIERPIQFLADNVVNGGGDELFELVVRRRPKVSLPDVTLGWKEQKEGS